MTYTRRDVLKGALATVSMIKSSPMGAFLAGPSSKYGGVPIGIIISPYNFKEIPVPADELLKVLLQMGISGIEMQDVRVEVYAGAPSAPRSGYSGSARVGAGGGSGSGMTREQRMEEQRKTAEELTQWRLSAPLSKYEALRKMYNDAGVDIYAFRLANFTPATSDEEFEYFFHAGQALGAKMITAELPNDPGLSKRAGDFAAKYKMPMGYHNHTQVNYHSWDTALAQSEYNCIQLDVGHYVAATSESPIPFLKEHHDRIVNLHLKDRKSRTHGGENMPWGQGDTPLKEILRLMKTEHYPFPAGIELEYPIPEGSSFQAEVGKCLQYCKDALA